MTYASSMSPAEEPAPAETSRRQEPVAVAAWKAVQPLMRGFDAMLLEHGATWQVWHILLALHTDQPGTQRELASAVGIREATLTHHLAGMEARGLVRRTRAPENRRVQRVEVTDAGTALFAEIRDAAVAYDRRLRDAIGTPDDVARFLAALGRLVTAVPEGGRDLVPADWPRAHPAGAPGVGGPGVEHP